MKKLSLLLSVILLCLCAFPAGAESLTLLAPASDYSYIDMQSACVAGDSAYFLASDNGIACLYRWRSGMAREEVMIADLDLSANRLGMPEAVPNDLSPELDTAVLPESRTFSVLFSDGERVMSLDLVSGKVFSVKLVDYEQVYEDVVTLQSVDLFLHAQEDYVYFPGAGSTALIGSKLLVFIQDWNDEGYEDNRIVIADLETGAVTRSAVPCVKALCEGPDGQAIIVTHDDLNAWQEDGTIDKPTVCLYDPVSDTARPLSKLPLEYMTSTIGYNARFGAMLYVTNNRIMGYSLATGEVRQYGFLSDTGAGRCNLLCLDDLVIIPGWSGIVIRPISDAFSSERYLNIYGSWSDEGRALFSARHPDVPVYDSSAFYATAADMHRAMASGEDAPDVLCMDVSFSDFLTLRDKGWCADLSAWPALTQAAERLYPLFRATVTAPDGSLAAIPLSAYSSGWSVHTSALAQLGLTMEDIPTNYVDLCAFINRFNDEMAQDYEELTLFDNIDSLKAYLSSQALKDYLDWCGATGREVSFDTPEFRAVMTAIDGLHTDHLKQNDYERELYYFNLFAFGDQVVGNFADDNEYTAFLPMTLTSGTDFFTAVNVRVMVINPLTPHMDLAAELLSCEVEGLPAAVRHTLYTDETQPVANPRYDEMLRDELDYIASLQQQLAVADPADKESLQRILDSEQAYVDANAEAWRYEISPAAIDRYVNELAPRMTLDRPTFMTDDLDAASPELRTLFDRYIAGQITLEQFIREADNLLSIARMGGY